MKAAGAKDLCSELVALLSWGRRRGIEDLRELIAAADDGKLFEYCILYWKKMGLYDG